MGAEHHRASVREETAHGGRVRQRCTDCGKVAYPDGDRAAEAAAKISERVPMRAYYRRRCGWWHVTTTRKGRAALRRTQEDAHWDVVLQDPRAHGVRIYSVSG